MNGRQRPNEPAPQTVRRRWPGWLGAAAATLMAAYTGWEAWHIVGAEWHGTVARQQVAKWSAGKETWSNEQWERALSSLQRSSELTPLDPTVHESLAQLYALRGQVEWTTGKPGTPEARYYALALQSQQQAVQLRPSHPMGWANLALYRYGVDAPSAEIFEAWRQALRQGPNEQPVRETLMAVASTAWYDAPEDVRAWVEKQQPGMSAKLDEQFSAPDPGPNPHPNPQPQ